MKYIFLVLAILIPQSLVKANNYTLSLDSQTDIVKYGAIGGLLGAGLGYWAYCKIDPKPATKTDSVIKKIVSSPFTYCIPAAIICAALAGHKAYTSTPEMILTGIEDTFNRIEKTKVEPLLPIDNNMGFIEKYITKSINSAVEDFPKYAQLQSFIPKLNAIIGSNRVHLHIPAMNLLHKIVKKSNDLKR